MPSNKQLIGKRYPQIWSTLSASQGRLYAAATADLNPRYDTEGLAPPMAVVILSIPHGVAQVVQDTHLIGDPVRLLRLLHMEEHITWHQPLRLDAELGVTATLLDIEDRPAGEVLRVQTQLLARSGDTVAQTLTTLMIRERHPGVSRKEEPPRPPPPAAPEWSTAWSVTADQADRYAQASGDHNPIHLDDAIARQAGLRGRILHGLCTMALAQGAVVQRYGADRPDTLRALRVRFSRPVYMGDTITCACAPAATQRVEFVVKNQDNQAVLTEGEAHFSRVPS